MKGRTIRTRITIPPSEYRSAFLLTLIDPARGDSSGVFPGTVLI